jgi:acylphosphatase
MGRVQGVGFRAWTIRRATELGLRGTVRNLDGGEVEVEVMGAPESVERLRELLRRGPSLSRVREVRELPPGSEDLPDHFAAAS